MLGTVIVTPFFLRRTADERRDTRSEWPPSSVLAAFFISSARPKSGQLGGCNPVRVPSVPSVGNQKAARRMQNQSAGFVETGQGRDEAIDCRPQSDSDRIAKWRKRAGKNGFRASSV